MKNKEEILNQLYVTAKDIKILIPTLGINNCRELAKQINEEETNKGNYIPSGRTIIAPTKAIRKKLGL